MFYKLTSDLIYETDKNISIENNKILRDMNLNVLKILNHTLEVQFGKNFMHIPNVIEKSPSLVPFIEQHHSDSVDEMNEAFSKSISYLKRKLMIILILNK